MRLRPIPPASDLRGQPAVSVIVPFYNEREVLAECVERVERVLVGLGQPAEIVLVDDGSDDGSFEILADRPQGVVPLRLLRLSRNFGKEAAMSAGLEHARGAAVVVLDADLQDPPELIPDMVAAWQEGADVVLMQRRTRDGEGWLKRASAHAFYRLLQRMSPTEIPLDTGDFRLMSRRAVNALLRLPERNRYMKGLYAWVGMRTVTLGYDRAPRQAGSSKWNFPALAGLAFEGITSFSVAPLRIATFTGLLAACAGAAFGAWIVLKALLLGDPVAGYPSLVAIISFLGGMQLLGIGVLGEYVGKTYLEAKQRPVYLLQDEVTVPARVLEASDVRSLRRHA
jgi:glycosyltransferase involved in cell wall biosynthesis